MWTEKGRGREESTYGWVRRDDDQVRGGTEVGVVPRRRTKDRCWGRARPLPRQGQRCACLNAGRMHGRGHGPRTSRAVRVSCGRRSTTVSAWFSLLKTTQRRRPSSARALPSPPPRAPISKRQRDEGTGARGQWAGTREGSAREGRERDARDARDAKEGGARDTEDAGMSSSASAYPCHVDDMGGVACSASRALAYLSRRYVRGPSSASACSPASAPLPCSNEPFRDCPRSRVSLCPTHRVQHGLAEDDVLHRGVLQQLHVRHRRLSAREHASRMSMSERKTSMSERKTSMSEGRRA